MTDFAKTPRRAAAEAGATTYVADKPCTKGHTDEGATGARRFVSDGNCVVCARERGAKARRDLKAAILRGRQAAAERTA